MSIHSFCGRLQKTMKILEVLLVTLAQNTIRYEVAEKIATITLHRPHVKNALNNDMHTELFAAFKEADRDPQVAVIVLQGSEGAFSAGADLKSVPLENHDDFNYGHSLRDTYNRLILTIAGMNKPTIAYLNGIAVGAGLSIALACDFRVAAPEAKLALSFIRIGLVPDAGAPISYLDLSVKERQWSLLLAERFRLKKPTVSIL